MIETGRCEPYEKAYIAKDGRVVPIYVGAAVLTTGPSTKPEVAAYIVDMTSIKEAQAALRNRTQELEAVLSTVPAGVWFTYDPQVRQVSRNQYAADLMGVPLDTTLPLDPRSDAYIDHLRMQQNGVDVPPDRMPLQRAMRGDEARDEEYEMRFADGSVKVLLANAKALRDNQDSLVGAVVVALDITERRKSRERLHLLMREITHRSKNLLAVIQAMARQTAARSLSTEDFLARFTGRLQGLAASHDILTNENWEGGSIRDLIASQLSHYSELLGRRILLSGPHILLDPEAAQNTGLALHELSTNAAKYGALSNAQGRVTIEWGIRMSDEGEKRFWLVWQERGGPPVSPPQHKGFGRMIIEGLATRAILGTATLDYALEGVTWRMDIPAKRVLEV